MDLLNMLLIKAAIELFLMRPVVSLAKVMLWQALTLIYTAREMF